MQSRYSMPYSLQCIRSAGKPFSFSFKKDSGSGRSDPLFGNTKGFFCIALYVCPWDGAAGQRVILPLSALTAAFIPTAAISLPGRRCRFQRNLRFSQAADRIRAGLWSFRSEMNVGFRDVRLKPEDCAGCCYGPGPVHPWTASFKIFARRRAFFLPTGTKRGSLKAASTFIFYHSPPQKVNGFSRVDCLFYFLL